MAILASTTAMRVAGASNPQASSSFDFSISVAGAASGYQGLNAYDYATVSLVSGTAQSVSLACSSGLPQGASCSFSPASGTPGYTSTIKVSTSPTTPVGTYTVQVVGTGGGVSHSAHFDLTVKPAIALGGTTLTVDWIALLAPFLIAGLVIASAGAGAAYLLRRTNSRKLA